MCSSGQQSEGIHVLPPLTQFETRRRLVVAELQLESSRAAARNVTQRSNRARASVLRLRRAPAG
jgi:hypothetical protein